MNGITSLIVLVIGSGGREHGLAWLMSQSSLVGCLYVAPGNPGIGELKNCVCVDIPARNRDALVAFAREQNINLVVIGPEDPICSDGLADELRRAGIAVFAPSQLASVIESSKSWALRLMFKVGVPTVKWFRVFRSATEAKRFIRKQGPPLVVKADGLAAGKGVVPCNTVDQALRAVDDILVKNLFGPAGDRIVVTEHLGCHEEVSFMAVTDGQRFIPLPLAEDHKRLLDGDKGPNTGGMGAFAPTTVLTVAQQRLVQSKIVRPILRELARRGRPYIGCLYVGLMLTPDGIKVVEVNCRFGDPETQAQVPLLNPDDFVAALYAAAQGQLAVGQKIRPSQYRSAACVVKASGGYPGPYKTGCRITGIKPLAGMPGLIVFHAGTARAGNRLVTAGGRVFGVTGYGANLEEAIRLASHVAEVIWFMGNVHRRDIGKRELARVANRR